MEKHGDRAAYLNSCGISFPGPRLPPMNIQRGEPLFQQRGCTRFRENVGIHM